ncbi:MAG: flavin reductase family protein [Candidatus Schekmanbacteria bacterium]|nr:flavin reductase family protein [Candidatus Schekmanbacteria bacterium]
MIEHSPIAIPPAAADADFATIAPATLSGDAVYFWMTGLIVPRPIAFVTTLGPAGLVNAAPFSFFNGVCSTPPLVSLAISRRGAELKDTLRNVLERRELVINICNAAIAKAISVAAGDFGPELSEIELTGLSLLPSTTIKTPRVANAPAQLECRLDQAVEVGGGKATLVLAEITMIHVHRAIVDERGRVDIDRLDPLARLSGTGYARLGERFNIPRGLV